MKLNVLDHGFVRLVSYMQPVPEGHPDAPDLIDQGGWTGDLEISRNARVSYNAEGREEDANLIHYLYRNRHTTPFEAMVFTFEIKCPLFIARQWHRHRTWSYNEVSARYTQLDEGFYVPALEQITTQSTDNKQMRTKEQHPSAENIAANIRMGCRDALLLYEHLIAAGTPRELARSVLPVSAYTRFFGTVDLHNLFHFLRLRLHEHAQHEIRVYAEALLSLIKPICPIAVAAFEEGRQ